MLWPHHTVFISPVTPTFKTRYAYSKEAVITSIALGCQHSMQNMRTGSGRRGCGKWLSAPRCNHVINHIIHNLHTTPTTRLVKTWWIQPHLNHNVPITTTSTTIHQILHYRIWLIISAWCIKISNNGVIYVGNTFPKYIVYYKPTRRNIMSRSSSVLNDFKLSYYLYL